MLSLIRIRNFATIDELEIEFRPGFNVLTGETGAGKSILIDALGLALGDRADSGVVRHGTAKAEISVVFDAPKHHPSEQWLDQHALLDQDNDSDETQCSLRRVIHAEGRSRAFINNQPVKLQDLRELGSMLIDLHGQHEHHALLESRAQRNLLDEFADTTALAQTVRELFYELQQAKAKLMELESSIDARQSQIELLQFQTRELTELNLVEGEIEKLVEEHRRLASVDDIASATQLALDLLSENESASAQQMLARSIQCLTPLNGLDETEAAVTQLRSAEIEIADVISGLAHLRDNLEPNPQRLSELESRLAATRSLATRHQVEDALLWQHAIELQQKLAELESGDLSEAALQASVTACNDKFEEHANKLAKQRRSAGRKLSQIVSKQTKELGIGNGEFTIEFTPKSQADGYGNENIEFQVRLNPGSAFAPLSRVASGGELSRISLALQVTVGGVSGAPTFVFDEVDAGIGGGTAEIVGNKLLELAQKHQILCITHQAQVACKGDVHFKIAKLSDQKTSRTRVAELTDKQRVDELARMIGGIEITSTTRAHAREMIDRTTASNTA